jgi:hypothetical protein
MEQNNLGKDEFSREAIREGLRKSVKAVGMLQKVKVEKGTMNILDGKTRKSTFPDWTEEEVEITDHKQRILIPMHSNYRRNIPRKETQEQILGLIAMLEEEKVPEEKIPDALFELTPFSIGTLRSYLPARFKKQQMAREPHPPTEEPKFATGPSQIAVLQHVETRQPTSAPTTDYGVVKKEVVCPHCGTALEVVQCPRCLREMSVKQLKI